MSTNSAFSPLLESKAGPELKRWRDVFTGVLSRLELAVVQAELAELKSEPNAELRRVRAAAPIPIPIPIGLCVPFVKRGKPFNRKLTEPLPALKGGGEGGGGRTNTGCTFSSLSPSPGSVHTGKTLEEAIVALLAATLGEGDRLILGS